MYSYHYLHIFYLSMLALIKKKKKTLENFYVLFLFNIVDWYRVGSVLFVKCGAVKCGSCCGNAVSCKALIKYQQDIKTFTEDVAFYSVKESTMVIACFWILFSWFSLKYLGILPLYMNLVIIQCHPINHCTMVFATVLFEMVSSF